MYQKIFVIGYMCAIIVSAGISPVAVPASLVGAPVPVPVAPLIKTGIPIATSYQNTFKISNSVPIVKTTPLAYAAPFTVAHPSIFRAAATPLAPYYPYSAAPALLRSSLLSPQPLLHYP